MFAFMLIVYQMKVKKILGFEEEYSRLNDLNVEVMCVCIANLLGGSQTLAFEFFTQFPQAYCFIHYLM